MSEELPIVIVLSVMPGPFLNPLQLPALVPPSAAFWPVPCGVPPLLVEPPVEPLDPAVVLPPPDEVVVPPPPPPVVVPPASVPTPPWTAPPAVVPLTRATVAGSSWLPQAARPRASDPIGRARRDPGASWDMRTSAFLEHVSVLTTRAPEGDGGHTRVSGRAV